MNDTKGWHRAQLRLHKPGEDVPVPIVSDAIIATTGVADGKLIPLVIVDTTLRPDIDDTVKAHASLGPGDVTSYWSRPSRWHTWKVTLILDFLQPAACIVALECDVGQKGGLLDAIVQAQGLYLQPGRPGDRLRDKLEAPRILVEVSSREFRQTWDQILQDGLTRRFRREGMSKRDAKRHALETIARWRIVRSQRMRDRGV